MSKPGPRYLSLDDSHSHKMGDVLEDSIHLWKENWLLLGTKSSGKSTICKQLRLLSQPKCFKEQERLAYKETVYSNIIDSMKMLVTKAWEFSADEARYAIGVDARDSANILSNFDGYEVDASLSKHIKTLWKDRGIRATFERRWQFQLIDSAKYLFSNIDRISEKDYIPSETDLIRCCMHTTGFVDHSCTIRDQEIRIRDVGGSQKEIKKWQFAFHEDIKALIYVCDLSGFYKKIYEGERVSSSSKK